MAHHFRFLADHCEAGQWTMRSEEWHHLLSVLRLPVGAEFELTNGKGWVAHAKLTAISKQVGCFEVLDQTYSPELPAGSRFILAIGALRPQSVDDLLPYLIELGVDAIEIFSFQGMDKNRLQDKVCERWDRILTAAMKQCKRAWIGCVNLVLLISAQVRIVLLHWKVWQVWLIVRLVLLPMWKMLSHRLM